MEEQTERRLSWAVLGAIVAYGVGSHIWFIAADTRPVNINELSHIMGPIDFANLVTRRPSLYGAYLEAFNGYPPIGVVASLFYWVLGRAHDAAVYSQLVFTTLLILGMYAVGAKVADRRTGLLAAWLIAVAPASLELSRQYLLEMPLAALSVWTVFALLATDGFRRRRWSLAAGAAAGLAALSKQSFFVFLLGPTLFVLPAWWRAMREHHAHAAAASRRGWRAAGCVAAAGAIAWLLYGGSHQSMIAGWFAAYPRYQLPWATIFLATTTVMLAGLFWLLVSPPSPGRNGVAALLLAISVASLWYFPKGVLNFVIYLDQMRQNVEQAGMSPATLFAFYVSHFAPYYLGHIVLGVGAAAAATVGLVALATPTLRPGTKMRAALPPARAMGLAALWFGVAFAAFMGIAIQNEMNSVPLVPPLALAAALAVTYARVPKGETVALPTPVRRVVMRTVDGWRIALIAALVGGGLLMATPWPKGTGFAALPDWAGGEAAASRWFPRKLNDAAYLVPQTGNWHIDEIGAALFAGLADVPEGEPAPRVLAMDVEYYFSWNTFWYESKLMEKRVEIRTPWYGDEDILDPESPDFMGTYERILYRTAGQKIYYEEKIRNDYETYSHLLAAFTFLMEPPAEFDALYPVAARWELPDGTRVVLRKRVEG